jgi:hypothetical protein
VGEWADGGASCRPSPRNRQRRSADVDAGRSHPWNRDELVGG